jgi:hypothetical protein
VTPLAPPVEIAHHEHLPRPRRPHGKVRSLNSIFDMRMRAQLSIKASMTAFIEEIEILIGE